MALTLIVHSTIVSNQFTFIIRIRYIVSTRNFSLR